MLRVGECPPQARTCIYVYVYTHIRLTGGWHSPSPSIQNCVDRELCLKTGAHRISVGVGQVLMVRLWEQLSPCMAPCTRYPRTLPSSDTFGGVLWSTTVAGRKSLSIALLSWEQPSECNDGQDRPLSQDNKTVPIPEYQTRRKKIKRNIANAENCNEIVALNYVNIEKEKIPNRSLNIQAKLALLPLPLY